jgi:hypothetical protein
VHLFSALPWRGSWSGPDAYVSEADRDEVYMLIGQDPRASLTGKP